MTELWKHQREIIDLAKDRNYYAILADPGTGKSRIMIEILRHKYSIEKRILRTLIVCPKIVCDNWREEFKKYSKIKKESIHILEGTGANRLIIIEDIYKNWERGAIVICNYQTLLMPEVFDMFLKWKPEALILDEAHRIKNHKAETTKRAIGLSKICRNRFILTGTPILSSLLDVFTQWQVLDQGASFGNNFFTYQRQFFYDKNAGKQWATWKEWVLKEHSDDMIRHEMAKSASFVKKEECLDLPPYIRKTIEVPLTPDQRKHYNQMHQDLITYVSESQACVASIALTKALRLQQIVCGFMTVTIPNSNETQVLKLKNNREDVLKELLTDLVANGVQKIIIWACFKENYAHIRHVCESLELGFTELHGECTDKQKKDALNDFREKAECVVLIGNQGAAGIGINLVEAPCAVYYSRNFSLEHDIQSEARNYRGGSERHASIIRYDLVSRDTIDADVIESLRNKKSIGDNILNFIGGYRERRGKDTDSRSTNRKVQTDQSETRLD
jgi:SNF2 family DNA or RNA helicase